MQQSTGFVIWLTGMKRAGKTTLATHVVSRFNLAGRRAELFDEDGEAAVLLQGLGPSKEDQATAVRRLGVAAKAVSRVGGVAVCAALSPYREARELLRKEARRFVEVFVDCPMEALMQRDGKEASYKKAMAGELTHVVGVDLPYEPPAHAELVLRTDLEPVEACVTRIFQALVDQKFVGPAEFGRLTGGQRPKRKVKGARKGGGSRGARKAPKKMAARTAKVARRK